MMYEEFIYDEDGNIFNGILMDYLVLIVVELLNWEMGYMIILFFYYFIGVKGVGEFLIVGVLLVIVNVIVDVLSFYGIMYMDILIIFYKVWKVLKEKGVVE